jgi:hypothetical protein
MIKEEIVDAVAVQCVAHPAIYFIGQSERLPHVFAKKLSIFYAGKAEAFGKWKKCDNRRFVVYGCDKRVIFVHYNGMIKRRKL